MIAYMERTRAYYAAQGYKPYQWAHNTETPFTPLHSSLQKTRLALITTAAPFRPDLADQGPGAKYNAEAKFYQVFTRPIAPPPDLRISHIGYGRVHCKAEDPRTWLPIEALQAAQQDHFIGDLAEELVGVPTNRSQRTTLEQDAPAALAEIQRLQADLALLGPT